MRNFYLRILRLILILGIAMPGFSGLAYSQAANTDSSKTKKPSAKITDTRANKPSVGVKLPFIPFKPGKDKFFGNLSGIPMSKLLSEPEKVLNNVKIYPNPVKSDLNLTYTINKDSNVTIKVMDVLGNEVAILLTERINAGVKTNSFNISSRLNSGFYFVRVSVGSEIVTKRISVL